MIKNISKDKFDENIAKFKEVIFKYSNDEDTLFNKALHNELVKYHIALYNISDNEIDFIADMFFYSYLDIIPQEELDDEYYYYMITGFAKTCISNNIKLSFSFKTLEEIENTYKNIRKGE